jgi:hypothetical protein
MVGLCHDDHTAPDLYWLLNPSTGFYVLKSPKSGVIGAHTEGHQRLLDRSGLSCLSLCHP